MPKSCFIYVPITIGHKAVVKDTPSPEGFTHDWHIYVQGTAGSHIEILLEKVIFELHPSFPNPKRICWKPPYEVKESGYAIFSIPVTLFFKSKQEPRCATFNYDLILYTDKTAVCSQVEKVIFKNPAKEWKKLLLDAGGRYTDKPFQPAEEMPSTVFRPIDPKVERLSENRSSSADFTIGVTKTSPMKNNNRPKSTEFNKNSPPKFHKTKPLLTTHLKPQPQRLSFEKTFTKQEQLTPSAAKVESSVEKEEKPVAEKAQTPLVTYHAEAQCSDLSSDSSAIHSDEEVKRKPLKLKITCRGKAEEPPSKTTDLPRKEGEKKKEKKESRKKKKRKDKSKSKKKKSRNFEEAPSKSEDPDKERMMLELFGNESDRDELESNVPACKTETKPIKSEPIVVKKEPASFTPQRSREPSAFVDGSGRKKKETALPLNKGSVPAITKPLTVGANDTTAALISSPRKRHASPPTHTRLKKMGSLQVKPDTSANLFRPIKQEAIDPQSSPGVFSSSSAAVTPDPPKKPVALTKSAPVKLEKRSYSDVAATFPEVPLKKSLLTTKPPESQLHDDFEEGELVEDGGMLPDEFDVKREPFSPSRFSPRMGSDLGLKRPSLGEPLSKADPIPKRRGPSVAVKRETFSPPTKHHSPSLADDERPNNLSSPPLTKETSPSKNEIRKKPHFSLSKSCSPSKAKQNFTSMKTHLISSNDKSGQTARDSPAGEMNKTGASGWNSNINSTHITTENHPQGDVHKGSNSDSSNGNKVTHPKSKRGIREVRLEVTDETNVPSDPRQHLPDVQSFTSKGSPEKYRVHKNSRPKYVLHKLDLPIFASRRPVPLTPTVSLDYGKNTDHKDVQTEEVLKSAVNNQSIADLERLKKKLERLTEKDEEVLVKLVPLLQDTGILKVDDDSSDTCQFDLCSLDFKTIYEVKKCLKGVKET